MRSLLLEPDMEDLSAIIPNTFDFVEELDDNSEEDMQPNHFRQPSLGKCQSLFATP